MKKSIFLFLKGFVMGIANIIPGVSGGTLALIMGIYEDFIGALSHFFGNLKKNILFLLPLGIGIIVAIASMSNVIDYAYNHFPLATSLFFMGLVVGGIPMLTKKVKGKKDVKLSFNIITFILTFSLVIFMAVAPFIFSEGLKVSFDNLNIIGYILLVLVGILAAGTMVIPGVSGSLVLMLLGYYYPIVGAIKSLVHFDNIFSNVIVLGLFGVGVLIGIVLISKLFEYLFNKHETITYYGVLGFIYASVLAIPISLFGSRPVSFNILEIIIGLLISVVGYFVAYKLGDK